MQILIDCPEPLLRMFKEASNVSGRDIDVGKIDHIVLTHLHGDHANGLECLGFYQKFTVGRETRPMIYTSNAVAEDLWKRLEPAMGMATMPPDNDVEHYELSDYFGVTSCDFGERFNVGEVEFEIRRTLHFVPCFGFKATYRGKTFGYSCDTTFDPEHIKFLEPSDLIFHETGTGYHAPIEDLEALPDELCAKLHVIHLEDSFAGSEKLPTAQAGKIYTL